MKFCKKCITPTTRPDLVFDEQGICDACRCSEEKHLRIDWERRKKEFGDFIASYKRNDPLKYDCLIPVSGGKDSHYTLYWAKHYGLKPLCVCFEPTIPTELGRENLDNISKQGVDLIHFKRNPVVYEKLILEGFKRVGDMEWINHQGIWTVPVHFALKLGIPLILWGESPQLEYGGSKTVSEKNKKFFDEDWLNDYGCLNGLRPQDLVGEKTGINLSDLTFYLYPPKDEIKKADLFGLFMGYYFKWNTQEQLDIVKEMGFKTKKGRIEISYTDYCKLDCLSMNLHDYLKYVKYGYGRATDEASKDIRNGTIDRDQAVRLAEKYDGKYPVETIIRFCEHFKMTREEFDRICDGFTNSAIFEKNNNTFIRDIDGSLVMKQKYLMSRRNP